jgi:zinc protease
MTEMTKGFFYEEVLPNVHLLVDRQDRESVSLEIMYHVGGSFFEADIDRGKKHLLEHCIAARTKDMNHEELKRWEFRENIGLNAYTARVPMALICSGYKADFKEMFDRLLEMAFFPSFSQEDLDREKEIVLREISERRGDPNYKLYFYLQNQLFTEDSIERHEVLGDAAMVAQTTLEDFVRLHKENMATSNIVVLISGGGIDLEYVKMQVKNEYEKVLADPTIKFEIKPVNYEVPSKLLEFEYKTIVHEFAHEHTDLYIYIPATIALNNQASRSIFHSLFMQYGGVLYDRLRDEKQLVYGINSWADKENQHFVINMEAESDKVEQILAEVTDIFSDWQKYFNEEKFKEFQNIVYKKQALAKDKLGTSVSFTKNNLVNYGVVQTYDEYTDILKNVTTEEVKNFYTELQNGLAKKQVVAVTKTETKTEKPVAV